MPFKFPKGWGAYIGVGVLFGICLSIIIGHLLPWQTFSAGPFPWTGFFGFLVIGIIWTILISYEPKKESS